MCKVWTYIYMHEAFSRARHAAIPSVHIFRDWRVAREGNEFAFNVALIMSLAAESAHV